MIERRIIPISSGKGGVGKTTLALNYALSLSRHGRCVLIDLDTGTSSVRSAVDTPVERDLYHFFKKGFSLADCITTLDRRLDPQGAFSAFGFVAAPRHLIEDITNFTPARRRQLIEAINSLKASFIVLDLKAGLDQNVIEFLPTSNSGILVFTPHLPAATLAAADIVKAILFRKLRALFAEGSPVYAGMPGVGPGFVNGLIDQVEDVYASGLHNLDAFVTDLQHALGEHPVSRLVAEAVDTFVVHYVLNRFDGVKSSYDSAVRPFAESLAENVSAHLTILNLGWVVESEAINQASLERVPALLRKERRGGEGSDRQLDRAWREVEGLAARHLPSRGPSRPARPVRAGAAASAPSAPGTGRYLSAQLDTLRRMYEDMGKTDYRDNFAYLTARSLHVMASRRTGDFGDVSIFAGPEELRDGVQQRGR